MGRPSSSSSVSRIHQSHFIPTPMVAVARIPCWNVLRLTLLLTLADARVYDVSSGHSGTSSQTKPRGTAIQSTESSGLFFDLVDWEPLLPQADERLSRRNLLQISGGTSGSCNLVASGGSILHSITVDDCSRAPTGGSKEFVACCSDVCTNSASGVFCTCTGYTDASVTCGGTSTLAGCCSLAGGGSLSGNSQPITPPPVLTPQATLPPTPSQPPPTNPPPTTPPQTPAPTPPPTTPAPTPPPTALPTPSPTVPATIPPTTPLPTLAPILPPPSSKTPEPTPTLARGVNPSSAPAITSNPAGVNSPGQTTLLTPSSSTSSHSSGANSIALKLGFGIASPVFAGLVTAATWLYFAYRYRSKKDAIIRATIDKCTDRDPNPILPNPHQYHLVDVRADLKVLLKRVMAKWDSWTGCSHKLSFPQRAELGIWKREFYTKESLVLVEALKDVDSRFCRTEGFEGLLDKWRNKETSRSYIVAEVCSYVDHEDVDRWKGAWAPGAVKTPSSSP